MFAHCVFTNGLNITAFRYGRKNFGIEANDDASNFRGSKQAVLAFWCHKKLDPIHEFRSFLLGLKNSIVAPDEGRHQNPRSKEFFQAKWAANL